MDTVGASTRSYLGKKASISPFQGWSQGLNTSRNPRWQMNDTSSGQLRVDMDDTVALNAWLVLTWTYDGSSTPGGLNGFINEGSRSLITVVNDLAGDATGTEEFGVGLPFAHLDIACGNGWDGGMRAIALYDKEVTGTELSNLLAYMVALIP